MKHSTIHLYLTATIAVMNPTAIVAQDCDPQEVQKLLPSDGQEYHRFGWHVAIDGDTAIVGAMWDNDPGYETGSAYIYRRNGNGDWIQTQEIRAFDTVRNDSFGFSVDMEGDIAVISAIGADPGGAAYIFQKDGNGVWAESQKIIPSDIDSGDSFGMSVAISGNTIVVGAQWDDDRGNNSGSAYIFRDNGNGTFVEIDKIIGSGVGTDHSFGRVVDISGDTAIVGASKEGETAVGSAYIFRDDGTGNWLELERLRASDGRVSHWFGHSVAIQGHTAVVGAAEDTDNGAGSGAAYIFKDSGSGNWNEIQKITPSDGGENQRFSAGRRALAFIDESKIVVGAQNAWGFDNWVGAAYFFQNDGAGNWSETNKIFAAKGESADFGHAIATDGTTVILGSQEQNDNGAAAGSAFIFDLNCAENCLSLSFDQLVAGEKTLFTISRGTPGARGVTVYGTRAGQTVVDNVADYCATFGIKGINQNKVIGGANLKFNAAGLIRFGVNIPGGASGLQVFFQSAQQGTCPDECMSNRLEATIQ